MTWVLHDASSGGKYWANFRDIDDELGCWYEASVRWDGCIHFSQAGNVPFDDEHGRADGKRDAQACDDYIHICDIDTLIARLQALKAAALQHFEGDWPQ